MNIKYLINAIIGYQFGKPPIDSAFQDIARRYFLKDPHYIDNIMSVIVAFRATHEDVVRDSHADRTKLNSIKRHIDSMIKSYKAIRQMEEPGLILGSITSIMEDSDIYRALELAELMQNAFFMRTRVPLEPSKAVLIGFVQELSEYWFHGTRQMPEPEFCELDGAVIPVPGTASAFICECLDEAEWEYSAERVGEAMGAIKIDPEAFDDEGETCH